MNKKNIIQVTIIIACFAASGIVIYNNFFKSAALPADSAGTNGSAALASQEPILPNGSNFDTEKINQSTLRFNLIEYPKLNYPQDVGAESEKIIRPLILKQNTGTN